jgi:hypothetical protein
MTDDEVTFLPAEDVRRWVADLDAKLAENPPAEESAVTVAPSKAKCRRHQWVAMGRAVDGQLVEVWTECERCHVRRDDDKARRGKQSRNYGNRAELKVARTYGGTKVGHAGGPVDVRGVDFDTQVKTFRRRPPALWKQAIGAMDGGKRCPRLLIRFVQPTGPEDYFVFRASDFLAWFGKDEEETEDAA